MTLQRGGHGLRVLLSSGLWALLQLNTACNDRFEFDVGTVKGGAAGAGGKVSGGGAPLAGGGAAGLNVGGASAGASGSAAGGGGGGEGEGGAGPSACGSLPACPSGLHCLAGECYECAEDTDCAMTGSARCEPERHRCVECVEKSDCAADFACDELANRCLRVCSEELECPETAHGCDEGRGVCYECHNDFECSKSSLGPFCGIDGSSCVMCKGEEDCAGQHCDQLHGRCVDCRDGRDCPSRLCDPATHTCLP